jgi:MYXO-CTERM domain-containing protein
MIAFCTGNRGQRCRGLFKEARTPFVATWPLILWAWLAVFSASQVARAGTLVQFNFNVTNGVNNQQSVLVDLFDDLTPHTVTNFMNYVNSGEYQNTVIHRSIPGFIIQGGGYGIPANLNDSSPFPHIATNFPSPINEFNYKNFTAQTGQSPSFPLQNFTANPVVQSNLVILNSIAVVSTHPSFQNPAPNLTADVNNDGFVHANDVNTVITDLLNNNNQVHPVAGLFSGSNYLDVNGDGKISASDVHLVIDALLATQSPSLSLSTSDAMQMSMATAMASPMAMAIVPEPASAVLAATGVLALGGYVLRRRRRVARIRSTH